MCADICVDMCGDMCVDMCVHIDMYTDMCIDIHVDASADMHLDMCVDIRVARMLFSVLIRDEPIDGSPFIVDFSAGTIVPELSSVTGLRLDQAKAFFHAHFTITTVDRFSNPLQRGGALVSVLLAPRHGDAVECQVVDSQDGR